MYNWSIDVKKLKKNKKAHAIWKLEQQVNFGLGGKKIKRAPLEKHWNHIQIDPARRKYLEILLHGKKHTH